MPLAAAGAALAIVIGAGSAYLMMRGSDDASGTPLNTQLLGQQGDAPTKAPGKIWSHSNDDILRGAGLDTSSSGTANLLSYGTNGMLLMAVPNAAVVALKEGDGSVAWQVKGSFETCQPLVNKGGWACVYSPPAQEGSSSSSGSTETSRQLVTLDGNGRLNKVKDLMAGESLLQERTGTLWVASGLDSANEDQQAGSSETRSVALTRLDDSGKAAWTFSRNLTMTSPTLTAGGEASRPLFTSDGVTYLRGAADSNGKGVAIDGSGKQTDKLDSPALANDQGRPITQKGSDFYDGGEKMKTPISNIMTPTMADTGLVPLYDTSDGKIRKLKSRASGVEWDVAASDASPIAYCGSTTVTTTDDNKVWYFDGKGKDIGSGQLNGSPQFCWGGKQLVSFDSSSTAVIGHDLASGQDAWRLNLKDDPNTAQMTGITYSPTSDGFVATGNGIAYYGPTK